MRDRSEMDAAKERLKQERLSQGQRGPEELQSHRQRKSEAIQKWQMSGAAASPVSECTFAVSVAHAEINSEPPLVTSAALILARRSARPLA